jgi:hypothetical protein
MTSARAMRAGTGSVKQKAAGADSSEILREQAGWNGTPIAEDLATGANQRRENRRGVLPRSDPV